MTEAVKKKDRPFNKVIDTDSLCRSVTQIFMQGAPKKKICPSTFYEYVRTAAYITMSNVNLSSIEIIKESIEQGDTPEEILGRFHMELKESWDILSKSKLGSACFRRMDIETIVNASGPSEILEKSVIRSRQ